MQTPLKKTTTTKKILKLFPTSQLSNGGRVDQVKTNGAIEGNKNKLSTYLVRTVNCPYSKISIT